MLERRFTKRFKKEIKLMGKQGRDLGKIRTVMDMIINEQPLPPKYENHPLHGKWKGAFGCHIQGDWVLIYETDDAARTVTFHHTDSHSDLF